MMNMANYFMGIANSGSWGLFGGLLITEGFTIPTAIMCFSAFISCSVVLAILLRSK